MKRLVRSWVALLTLAAFAAAAPADEPTARVAGGGEAALTDTDDGEFAGNRFAIAGAVYADGSARGEVDFLLGEPFTAVWGAVPEADFLRLSGHILAGDVAQDGTVTLRGLLTEVDYSYGDGVVFVEEDVPFEIVVSPDGGEFTLQWCLLPVYGAEVTEGRLTVK